MDYFYGSVYVLICATIFILMFMRNEMFNFFFKKIYNKITDYNDPNYTGGLTFDFNPIHFDIL